MVDYLRNLSEEEFQEKFTRPDTKWKISSVTNITFYINKLKATPLGAPTFLPNYIRQNRGLQNVSGDGNFCFFRCLAVFEGANNRFCETHAKKLYEQFCSRFGYTESPGIKLSDLVDLEDLYQINIIVYDLDKKVARLVQQSRGIYSRTMRLNVHQNHLSLITNFDQHCRIFKCEKCNKLWYGRHGNFLRHVRNCNDVVKEVFPGGVHRNTKSIFEKLADIGIEVPLKDRYFPFFCCFDFEAYFSKEEMPKNGKKLKFEARHIPLSVAVASNIPQFKSAVCFVSDGDSEKLVKQLLKYLELLADQSFGLFQEKFSYVFSALNQNINIRKETVQKEFQAYLQELIVLGFNSSNYDINLIKPLLIQQIYQKIQFVIKKANCYQCIKTDKFRFLDIRHFLAPGFSYKNFLTAYGCQQQKFFFPYEFMDDIAKLNFPHVPDHKHFHSRLTNTNITQEEYELVKQTWEARNWKSLRDLLVFYNNLDCEPFVEAVEKMMQPYLEEGLDIFKISFSVSGIAKFQMLNRIMDNSFFCLYPKRHADLFKSMRQQLTGGLSFVCTRLAIAGHTRIRSHEIEDAELCQSCLGYDANSLYLYAIQQQNPTGYFTHYRQENGYKPDPCSRYGLSAFQYLSWVSHSENKFIQHQFNQGEKILTQYNLKVDGYCERDREVIEFNGCLFHSCDLCSTNRNSDGSLKETNPINGRKHADIRKETLDKVQKLEEAGYKVRTVTECQWKKMKQQPDVAAFVKSLQCVKPRYQLSYKKIIEGVQKGELYGFLFVDVHTPEHLKEAFDDFPLVFKKIEISLDDVGPYMRDVAEQNGFLKKPIEYLISSHFGKKVLINSNMAKFYLEMGLQITKIYEFVEFYPVKCFEQLGNQIADVRRAGDSDPSKQVLALTAKLLGNSLYSASLLNKHSHRKISYCDNYTVNELINTPYFCNLECITDNVYEVKSLKQKIVQDLPIQLGLSVYIEAKLHMLKFVHCFLKKFVPKRYFEVLESDTDSLYAAFAHESLEECVPQNMKREFYSEKIKWMPTEVCPEHRNEFIEGKVAGEKWVMLPCCEKHFKYQKRTPGLFKLEYSAKKAVCLTAKTHMFESELGKKQVSKGASLKTNQYTFENYFDVLKSNQPREATNRGFMLRNHTFYTYEQKKRDLTPLYCKGIVLDDCVHTKTLSI